MFRIHADKEALEKLNEKDWLGVFTKFCKVSSITVVPSEVKYRTISRIQQKYDRIKVTKIDKKREYFRRRYKNIEVKMISGGLDNPYVELVSMSNGQLHR